jgi:hypothetical protein
MGVATSTAVDLDLEARRRGAHVRSSFAYTRRRATSARSVEVFVDWRLRETMRNSVLERSLERAARVERPTDRVSPLNQGLRDLDGTLSRFRWVEVSEEDV